MPRLDFMEYKFNKMDRQTRSTIGKEKSLSILNKIDLSKFSNGKAQYGWTGKGWVCWQGALILGYSAKCNHYWFNDLCQFLNDDWENDFVVDLGFQAPKIRRPNDDADGDLHLKEPKIDYIKEMALFFESLKK